MRLLRTLLFGLSWTAAVVTAPQALAVPCVLSSPTLVSAFTTCDLGSDTITKIGSTLPGTAQITFDTPSPGHFSIFVGFTTGFVGAGSSGTLSYTITALDSNGLVQAAILAGLGSPASAVTMTVVPGGVASVTGASSQTIEFNDSGFLTVTDSFSVGAGGLFVGFTNEFILPEPATLAMLGMGLLGLGLARRRRRRAL